MEAPQEMNPPPRDDSSSRQSRGKASFGTQARALFRKNGIQQKRAWKSSCFLVATPIFFCVLLFVLQKVINSALDTPDNRCGCLCTECCSTASGVEVCRPAADDTRCAPDESCKTYDTTRCGLQYSDSAQANWCSIPSPSSWPALMQAAAPAYLARPWAPAAAVLFTGDSEGGAGEMASRLVTADPPSAAQQRELEDMISEGATSGAVYAAALSYLGITMASWQKFPFLHYYIEPAFVPTDEYNATLYALVPSLDNAATAATVEEINATMALLASAFGPNVQPPTISPVALESVYRASPDDINSQLYCGYAQSRCNGTSATNAILQAWDFGATSNETGTYDARMWYNATGRYGVEGNRPTQLLRLNQGINRATNAFLSWALGPQYSATLLGIMGTPKPSGRLTLDFNALLGPLFYTWLLQLLLPVMLVGLVYEKERGLRSMMKMHGLGDGAYWAIQYVWFFVINFAYVWVLIGFGSLIKLSFFTATSYAFQFVFYLLWINCLIGFAFLLSTVFRSSRTAVVVAFLYVFGTGLVGYLLLEQFISRNHWWVVFLELIPGFALYRGLYEISQYAFRASYQATKGMSFSKLSDPNNGLTAVMIIFLVEWVVFMALAWYLEQVLPTGVGAPRHPLFFLGKYKNGLRKRSSAPVKPLEAGDPEAALPLEAEDVAEERRRVEALGAGADSRNAVVIHDLAKTFPATRGVKEKAAVRGLTLAIAKGECFGLLGPNGAGKSTTLNCLTGSLEPSSGTAVVDGIDIRRDLGAIYTRMGVCPQDNLLWEQLTAREHLLFYGRLKNLKGAELTAAADAALRSVNLLNGGTGEKQVRTYSGGMKRRLSVAISLIGDPSIVYMDEPSTGLDPASRQNLWDAVKQAKQDRGIILTTHSMEEATVLCDRLGIFVDGQLVCIGSPKELTARHGGYYVFTITTRPEQEAAAEALVRGMSAGARLTYALAGTRKYELPVDEVSLAGLFKTMGDKRPEVEVLDWGVHSATLEEVFIAFAQSIGAEGGN